MRVFNDQHSDTPVILCFLDISFSYILAVFTGFEGY